MQMMCVLMRVSTLLLSGRKQGGPAFSRALLVPSPPISTGYSLGFAPLLVPAYTLFGMHPYIGLLLEYSV
jgi:hypothetical protein